MQGRTRKGARDSAVYRIDAALALSAELRHNKPGMALAYARTACELARRADKTDAVAAALCAEGECHIVSSDYAAAALCFTEAIDLYTLLHNEEEKHRAMYYLATVHERTSHYREALHILSICLNYWQNREDGRDHCVQILNSMGIIYKHLDDFATALQHYMQCLHLLGEEESLRSAKTLLNIGNVYVHNHETARAVEYYERAQAIGIRIGDNYLLCSVLVNLANASFAQKEYERALRYYAQALETAGKYGAEMRLAILNGMGDVYMATEELVRALDVLYEAASLAEETGVRRRQVQALGSIGSVLCRMGEPERAIGVLKQSLAIAEEAGLMYHLYHIHKFLSVAYEQSGDVPQAYEYYKRYSELREEVMNADKQKALAEMQTRFDVERVAQQNEIYRLRTQQLEHDLSNRSNELAALILRLTEKNSFLQTMRGEILRHRSTAGKGSEKLMAKLLSLIDSNVDAEATWAAFEQQFNQIHHDFLHKLSERCPRLTTTELRICSLLKIQLASKDIANLLSLSPRTVESHRYNIRKKLQLDTPENLSPFLSSL